MFQLLFLAPLLCEVIDGAKHDVATQDKTLQHGFGFRHACDWSKAKKGLRPFDLHRLLRDGSLRDFRIALFKRLLDAELQEQPAPPVIADDRDMLRDIFIEVRQIAHAVGIRKPVKTELKEIA